MAAIEWCIRLIRMPDRRTSPAAEPADRSLARFVAHSLESSDAVAAKIEEFRQARSRRESARRLGSREIARTHTALERTESVLAQTARSLQRTACVLAPNET